MVKRYLPLLLLLVIIIYVTLNQPDKSTVTLTFPNDQKFNVELADTQTKRAIGLMYRKTLGQNSGMLFVFDSPQKHIFWMKNTYIPLDMIWLDENLTIVDITHNVQPCEQGAKCKTYMPAQPAKYVLEVNANIANENKLEIGQQLVLKKLPCEIFLLAGLLSFFIVFQATELLDNLG